MYRFTMAHAIHEEVCAETMPAIFANCDYALKLRFYHRKLADMMPMTRLAI